ncbi:hypothetical protein ACT3TY_06005 [Halomonas sp. AOP22-C1-8]|uniref:hypothetical protein n=1 Tax=Halomonas sp. AOP22-C1-8 TaxID=3457717 RepID=UPI004034BC90
MSYQPTYEDALYLLNEEWEAFGNAAEGTLRSLYWSQQNGEPIDEGAVANRVYQAYLDSGAEPLTESPISYFSNDSTEESGPDTAFAEPCVQCQQDAGCCLKAGSVSDKEDSSRKVEWPAVDGAMTLLVVARPQGNAVTGQLMANVEVLWEGETSCQNGRTDDVPCIGAYVNTGGAGGLGDGIQKLTDQKVDVPIIYNQPTQLAGSLNDFIPFDITLGFVAFDAVIGNRILSDQGGEANFLPMQCLPGKDISHSLKVVAYPYMKLEGNVTLAVETILMTSEVSAKVSATGTLSGQYGRHTLEWSRSAEAAGGETKSIPRQNDAPGLIGIMVDTIQKINRYFSLGAPSETVEYDRSSIGSGVIISKSLSFKPSGFELVPVPNSPDLQLNIGSMESVLSLGVTGRIDLIEVIASIALTPAGANRIQDARARIKAGEKVNATIEGYLQLSATGSLQHTLGKDGMVSYRIPASGEGMGFNAHDITSDFKGTLQILGLAEIKLHVEGSVFMVRAQAGVRGSIHTSWMWEVQNNDEGQRMKRYTFEGVRVSGEAYAEITSRRRRGGADEVGYKAEGSLELVAGEERESLSEQVDSSIDASNTNAARMSNSVRNRPLNTERIAEIEGDEGDGKTIWPKEEGTWVPF